MGSTISKDRLLADLNICNKVVIITGANSDLGVVSNIEYFLL